MPAEQAVSIACYVSGPSAPNHVSNVVRELATRKGFLLSSLGEVVAKGFEGPVRSYEVRWQAEMSPSEGSP